jgi:hypothetical protein
VDPQIVPLLTAALAAAAVIVAAIVNRPRAAPDPLGRLATMVEIWQKLPEGSQKKSMLALIDAEIARSAQRASSETLSRRNWYGVFWAVVFVGGGAFLGLALVSAGGLWLIALILPGILVLAGVIMFAQNVTKVPRAANGQTLAYQQRRTRK